MPVQLVPPETAYASVNGIPSVYAKSNFICISRKNILTVHSVGNAPNISYKFPSNILCAQFCHDHLVISTACKKIWWISFEDFFQSDQIFFEDMAMASDTQGCTEAAKGPTQIERSVATISRHNVLDLIFLIQFCPQKDVFVGLPALAGGTLYLIIPKRNGAGMRIERLTVNESWNHGHWSWFSITSYDVVRQCGIIAAPRRENQDSLPPVLATTKSGRLLLCALDQNSNLVTHLLHFPVPVCVRGIFVIDSLLYVIDQSGEILEASLERDHPFPSCQLPFRVQRIEPIARDGAERLAKGEGTLLLLREGGGIYIVDVCKDRRYNMECLCVDAVNFCSASVRVSLENTLTKQNDSGTRKKKRRKIDAMNLTERCGCVVLGEDGATSFFTAEELFTPEISANDLRYLQCLERYSTESERLNAENIWLDLSLQKCQHLLQCWDARAASFKSPVACEMHVVSLSNNTNATTVKLTLRDNREVRSDVSTGPIPGDTWRVVLTVRRSLSDRSMALSAAPSLFPMTSESTRCPVVSHSAVLPSVALGGEVSVVFNIGEIWVPSTLTVSLISDIPPQDIASTSGDDPFLVYLELSSRLIHALHCLQPLYPINSFHAGIGSTLVLKSTLRPKDLLQFLVPSAPCPWVVTSNESEAFARVTVRLHSRNYGMPVLSWGSQAGGQPCTCESSMPSFLMELSARSLSFDQVKVVPSVDIDLTGRQQDDSISVGSQKPVPSYIGVSVRANREVDEWALLSVRAGILRRLEEANDEVCSGVLFTQCVSNDNSGTSHVLSSCTVDKDGAEAILSDLVDAVGGINTDVEALLEKSCTPPLRKSLCVDETKIITDAERIPANITQTSGLEDMTTPSIASGKNTTVPLLWHDMTRIRGLRTALIRLRTLLRDPSSV
eukprot:Rmarinus@m.3274